MLPTIIRYQRQRKEQAMPITGTAYIPNVAPGIYQAVVTGCTEKAAKDDPTNVFRVWEFSLPDGRTVSGSSSLSTTGKSKGGKWIAALRGRPLEVGEVYEPVGARCTIIVAIKDTTGYEYVETVAPPDGTSFTQSHNDAVQRLDISSTPADKDAAAARKAAEQHAIQEGDEPEIGLLP